MSTQEVSYNGTTYDVSDFAPASEDWMGWTLQYCVKGDPVESYVPWLDVRKTSEGCEVYWVDNTDGDFPEHLLLTWKEDWEDGEYACFGDWDDERGEYEREFPAWFIWLLCDNCESFFN